MNSVSLKLKTQPMKTVLTTGSETQVMGKNFIKLSLSSEGGVHVI